VNQVYNKATTKDIHTKQEFCADGIMQPWQSGIVTDMREWQIIFTELFKKLTFSVSLPLVTFLFQPLYYKLFIHYLKPKS